MAVYRYMAHSQDYIQNPEMGLHIYKNIFIYVITNKQDIRRTCHEYSLLAAS